MSKVEFLNRLADLLEECDALMYYTTDDDGVHLCIVGEEGEDVAVISAWRGSDQAAELRAAAGVIVTTSP